MQKCLLIYPSLGSNEVINHFNPHNQLPNKGIKRMGRTIKLITGHTDKGRQIQKGYKAALSRLFHGQCQLCPNPYKPNNSYLRKSVRNIMHNGDEPVINVLEGNRIDSATQRSAKQNAIVRRVFNVNTHTWRIVQQ